MQWTPENRDCPVCKSSSRRTIGRRGGKSHRAGLGEEATVVRCKDCSVLYTYPTLLPQGNPYNEISFDDYFENHPTESKVATGDYLAKRAEKLIEVGSVLEVGCGGGWLLQGFAMRGWKCTGVEMTEAFANEAESRGITIIRQSAEEVEFSEKYDLIIFPAVLEHLYNPKEVLQKCVSALKPDGIIHIEVPNESALSLTAGNFYHKIKGRDWTINLSPTFPPFHVVGFNPKSIRRLIESVGLKIESLELALYNTTLPESATKTERTAMKLIQRVGSILGRGDGIGVWARKPK